MPTKETGFGSPDANIEAPSAPSPSYLSVKSEGAKSSNSRTFKVEAPLIGHDGGASGEYLVSLDRVPISMGGTDADNGQQAINNLLGLIKGAMLLCDGKNWLALLPGKEGQGLTTINGMPAWDNKSVPIASTASVVTLNDESTAIPNSVQLAAGDGIGVEKGSIAVDGTVVRTQAIKALEAALNALRDDSVLLEGDQVIQGNKLFDQLALNDKDIMADGQIYIFPPMADSLVGEEAIQTLTNKTLVDPIIESSCTVTFKTPTGNYQLKTVMPKTGRVYSFYDANTDGDIAIKSGIANEGSIAYGDGYLIKFTEQGSEGQPLISHAHKRPGFAVLGELGGGTGQSGYAPGDILFANKNGKLQKLPIGGYGQIMKVGLNGLPVWE